MLWSDWWNFSYINYLAVDLINATHTIIVPGPSNGTFWLAINLTNRWIPYGNHWWVNSWYVPWIEINITVGSVIKMWKTNGTVIGTAVSRIRLDGQETSIDCWKVQFSEPEISQTYTFVFDKQSGVGVQGTSSLEPHLKLTLVSTNIPIGTFVRMPCDINIDGKVDIRDIAFAGKSFGSYPQHPRWNPVADVYQDNKIDIKDIALIAKNFGKTYP